jgi:lysophospholipase L1-like esterase
MTEPVPAEPRCAALDAAKLAEVPVDGRVVRTPVPPIVDRKGSLERLWGRLAGLARGAEKDHVRIAVYGDSNMTMDYITGELRRVLQARFGDGGHGWVALGRPWSWYVHQDVRHDMGAGWRPFATSTHKAKDGLYGFANIAAESSTPGATTWVATAGDRSPVGRSVGRFDLAYLERPGGGTFEVRVDGRAVRTVATNAGETRAGFQRIDVDDGPHKLECVTAGDGPVRVFGVALEREGAAVIVDSLGVGALNYEQMQHVESTTRIAMLQRRKYDLVVFLLGTNMFMPRLHAKWVKTVLADFRAALPDAAILLMSPPDLVAHRTDAHSDPRIVALEAQMQEIADANDCAFWDFRAAMGGDLAIKRFAQRGLASRDHVHLTKDGGALMGDRFAHALVEGLRAHLAAHPTAGCPPAP